MHGADGLVLILDDRVGGDAALVHLLEDGTWSAFVAASLAGQSAGARSHPVIDRPLSAVERWILATSEAACLNFAAVGRIKGPLDEARVRSAIAAVQARHPLLTVRVDDSGEVP